MHPEPERADMTGIASTRRGRWGAAASAVAPLMAVLLSIASVSAADADAEALRRLQSPPLGLPPVPLPEDSVPTVEKIRLGRTLFFDRRLSGNGTMSCGMCHIPEQGFTNRELARPVGLQGASLRRNAPALFNVAYVGRLFHDGRETALETQALAPILAPDEMGGPSPEWLVARVRGLSDYEEPFRAAFGGGPSIERIGEAIATWERTILSGGSAFDRWRYGGEPGALTPAQRLGFALFTGRAGCADCHTVGEESALFTDGGFHDTGVGYRADRIAGRQTGPVLVEIAPGTSIPVDRDVIRSVGDPEAPDLGRFEVTGAPGDRWRFRTPGLRNVTLTAPYMHDGSLRTLEDVIEHYDRGGERHPGIDPLIRPLGLDAEEKRALVEFLEGLTGDDIDRLVADARSAPVANP